MLLQKYKSMRLQILHESSYGLSEQIMEDIKKYKKNVLLLFAIFTFLGKFKIF